jgi:hypothetical protein
MKKIKEFMKNRKVFVLVFLLAVGIIGVFGGKSTWAYLTANSFSLTNFFKPADVNSHIEEVVDDQPVKPGTKMLKKPVIINDGPSNSFIRARITVSPSTADVKLLSGSWSATTGANKVFTQYGIVYDGQNYTTNQSWVYNPADGFFYYVYPVAVGAKTASLFDAIVVDQNVDISIYQESVLATSQFPLGKSVDLSKIEALFDKVSQ